MIRSTILLLLFTASCYAQHPYINLTARQLVKQAHKDGYEIVSRYCDDVVTFTLWSETDTITVQYEMYRSKPVFVRYEE
jgi:hypothetical protein